MCFLFTKSQESGKIPEDWRTAAVVLQVSKRDLSQNLVVTGL